MTPRKPKPEPQEELSQELPPGATVEQFPHGWQLVTHGRWQISIGPDSLLLLPRSLKPSEVDEFCAAIKAAAAVSALPPVALSAENQPAPLSATRAIVTAGGVPAGAVRMPTAARTEPLPPRGSIGRRGPNQQVQQPPRVAIPQRTPTTPRLPLRSSEQ